MREPPFGAAPSLSGVIAKTTQKEQFFSTRAAWPLTELIMTDRHPHPRVELSRACSGLAGRL